MLQRSPPFSGFKQDILIKKPLVQILIFSSSIFVSSISLAQSISYAQAEQSVLADSYSTQANQALQQAARLEAEAVKGLGLPRVD